MYKLSCHHLYHPWERAIWHDQIRYGGHTGSSVNFHLLRFAGVDRTSYTLLSKNLIPMGSMCHICNQVSFRSVTLASHLDRQRSTFLFYFFLYLPLSLNHPLLLICLVSGVLVLPCFYLCCQQCLDIYQALLGCFLPILIW